MNLPFIGSLVALSLLVPMSTFALQTNTPSKATPSPVDGVWLGALQSGPLILRLQLHLQGQAAGSTSCSLDSIDQKAFGIPCSDVQFKADSLSLDVPAVSGKLLSNLSPDGKTLTGTWTQGGHSLPITLQHEPTAIEPPKGVAAALDPAVPPVGVAELKSVLDRDLTLALNSGSLAPTTNVGVTIGVVQHGERHVFSYGAVKSDSVFEIGSITKTFTGLILAQMAEQGSIRLDEPVRNLLPPGTVAKPATGAEITLLDLSDQHSGLPRMPDNFHPADPKNPYADYDAKLLYAFLAKQSVALPVNAPFGYSNVGVGLLGQALANRAKTSYPDLLHQQITGPLNMRNTGIALTADMEKRFIEGHDDEDHPAHAWDLDALAGAGGIRSTADDMLTYLEAQLHPDRLAASVLSAPNGKTLPSAIAKSHIVHADVGGNMHIALNWFRDDKTGSYWHNGGTGGYSSFALFNPEKGYALVVLTNIAPGPGSLSDKLGQHIEQRLNGFPAVSLATELRKTIRIDSRLLDGYVGAYQLAPNFVLTVTKEGDQLFTQATGQPRVEVFPESNKDFFLKVVDAQITFETDNEGHATGLILHQGGSDREAPRIK